MNHEMKILDVQSLVAGYGDNIILTNVSFALQKGEVLVVIGQNGSGKSTLLKTICGLIPKKGGRIFLRKNELNSITPNQLAALGISYFVQGGLIMPALTAAEHLELAYMANGKSYTKTFNEVFSYFPKLHEVKGKKAGNLSGGERQMLSFGILVMQQTNTWFLDEPTAGLAPSVVEFTAEFLQKKNKEEDVTMLIIEHNMDVAFRIASNIAVAKQGTLTKKFSEQDFRAEDFLNKTVYN